MNDKKLWWLRQLLLFLKMIFFLHKIITPTIFNKWHWNYCNEKRNIYILDIVLKLFTITLIAWKSRIVKLSSRLDDVINFPLRRVFCAQMRWHWTDPKEVRCWWATQVNKLLHNPSLVYIFERITTRRRCGNVVNTGVAYCNVGNMGYVCCTVDDKKKIVF